MGKCSHCQRRGHYPANCPQVVCKRCGVSGHWARDCQAKACYFCGKCSHLRKDCPSRGRKATAPAPQAAQGGSAPAPQVAQGGPTPATQGGRGGLAPVAQVAQQRPVPAPRVTLQRQHKAAYSMAVSRGPRSGSHGAPATQVAEPGQARPRSGVEGSLAAVLAGVAGLQSRVPRTLLGSDLQATVAERRRNIAERRMRLEADYQARVAALHAEEADLEQEVSALEHLTGPLKRFLEASEEAACMVRGKRPCHDQTREAPQTLETQVSTGPSELTRGTTPVGTGPSEAEQSMDCSEEAETQLKAEVESQAIPQHQAVGYEVPPSSPEDVSTVIPLRGLFDSTESEGEEEEEATGKEPVEVKSD